MANDKTPLTAPHHVAIILDGNGRWAEKQGKPRTFGHQHGAENVKEIVRTASRMGVKVLTVYAFSTENWKRPEGEVHFLMELFGEYLLSCLQEMKDEQVEMHIVGDRRGLSLSLQEKIRRCEEETAGNKGIRFNIAINYGGRHELVTAFQKLARQVEEGTLRPEDITEDTVKGGLYPPSAEDVDLLIRTGGESRISNFLLWQISYSELYFTKVLWPDFHADSLAEAIAWYEKRDRRFGGLTEDESW